LDFLTLPHFLPAKEASDITTNMATAANNHMNCFISYSINLGERFRDIPDAPGDRLTDRPDLSEPRDQSELLVDPFDSFACHHLARGWENQETRGKNRKIFPRINLVKNEALRKLKFDRPN